MTRITAQVAVEAIVNDPTGYETETMRVVLTDAETYGVAKLYVDMLRDALADRVRGFPA